jgi:hypothetical protein
MTAPAPPRLSDRARVDVCLDHMADIKADFATCADLLWGFVQADNEDELEMARRRARRYLLLS